MGCSVSKCYVYYHVITGNSLIQRDSQEAQQVSNPTELVSACQSTVAIMWAEVAQCLGGSGTTQDKAFGMLALFVDSEWSITHHQHTQITGE